MVELIVVLAIIAALCAILFPVFSSAKGAAEKTVCLSDIRMLGMGSRLYAGDYDDRLMPVNQEPAGTPNSRNDRTWVQILLPYVRSFNLFRCPSDNTARPLPEATFDQDLVPGDTDSQYYTASLRSDYGYNFQNLAPILYQGNQWVAQPKSINQIVEPSTTLLFVESAWSRTPDNEPTGGGNWLVVPPCRYYQGSHIDSFTGAVGDRVPVFTTAYGWNVQQKNAQANFVGDEAGVGNPELYGNAWPRHNGHMNVTFVDGSVRSLTPAELGVGCHVRDAWQGSIYDREKYLWDVN